MHLATNPSGNIYVSTSDLTSCKSYAIKKKICTSFVAYEAASRPLCELQILLSISKTLPEICTTSTFEARINTFQNIDNNQWLYILTEDTNCILQCKTEVTHHKLQGAGILSLPENCKLYTGYSTLTAFQSIEENVTYPVIVPDIRTDDCFEEYKNFEAPKLIPIKINEMPLDSLKQIKHHVDKFKESLENMRSRPILQRYSSTFTWIYFVLFITMLGYFIYKISKRCPNGLLLRNRRPSRDNSCIQIFNNCFSNTSRRQRIQVAVPMTTIATSTCVTEDEEENEENYPRTSTPRVQRLSSQAQSLF
ncbi:uncharacterized protein LOC128201498 [Galleria mellonella]|uniref:Uncharacterized protein LOC128201498 n=1 Tax=Galleria mellonella TaxID=7137 RepID=A0ABM3MTD6_GALME|nr:uncharacterized protein LOC128201498 [Galleria mellonella]